MHLFFIFLFSIWIYKHVYSKRKCQMFHSTVHPPANTGTSGVDWDGLLVQNIYGRLQDKNYEIDRLLYFLGSLTDRKWGVSWEDGYISYTMNFAGMLKTARKAQPNAYKKFKADLFQQVSDAITVCDGHKGSQRYDEAKRELEKMRHMLEIDR